jgi:hypothetical protein
LVAEDVIIFSPSGQYTTISTIPLTLRLAQGQRRFRVIGFAEGLFDNGQFRRSAPT